jgi:hypothetical protein
LTAEGASLNATLQRLETEKTAAEAKAHTMESVAYGGIATSTLLLVIVSSIFLVNRRRSIAAKQEGVGLETEASEVSPVVETPRATDGGDLQPAKTSNTASYSLDLAQSSSSDATNSKRQNGSGASDATSSSETDEERVTLPI